jgi:hypothetical protein
MKMCVRAMLCMVAGMILPHVSRAQGIASEIGGLQKVLDQLYNEMLPLCSQLIGVAGESLALPLHGISLPAFGGILQGRSR